MATYKKIPVLRATAGLNNVVDPVRLIFDAEKGIIDLAIAYNIDIDISGRVSRRPGQTLRGAFAAQDIFCDGGECLFVSGSNMYRLNENYTYDWIRSGLSPSAKMWYAQVGTAIYYANGYTRGRVVSGTNYTWVVGDYYGPVTSRVFSDPPDGITILEYFKGRMYAAKDSTIWYSEPYAPGWFDYSRNFISLPGNVIFIKGLSTSDVMQSEGMYIGTARGVYFVEGSDPDKFGVKQISTSVPILGTALRTNGNEITIMWAASDGIWVGKIGGKAECVTKDKLTYPSAVKGTSGFHNDKYIVLLQE